MSDTSLKTGSDARTAKFAAMVSAACDGVLDLVAKLQPLAEAIAEAQEEHGARCYAAYFEKQHLPAAEASVLGVFVLKLGNEFRERRLAERSAASLIKRLAQAETSLKISRCAQKIRIECERKSKMADALAQACWKAGVNDVSSLLTAAANRDEMACSRLRESVGKISRELVDPRGRDLILETATHAVFLAFLRDMAKDWKYTYDAIEGFCSDARTAVTYTALALDRSTRKRAFNPQPAYQLVCTGQLR